IIVRSRFKPMITESVSLLAVDACFCRALLTYFKTPCSAFFDGSSRHQTLQLIALPGGRSETLLLLDRRYLRRANLPVPEVAQVEDNVAGQAARQTAWRNETNENSFRARRGLCGFSFSRGRVGLRLQRARPGSSAANDASARPARRGPNRA